MTLLTLAEMAQRLRMTPKTFSRLIQSKNIPYIPTGKRKLFNAVAVEAWLNSNGNPVQYTSRFAAEVFGGLPPATAIALPAKPVRRKAQQYTYLVWAVNTTRYKIGIAVDPQKRLRGLATGSPLELELLAAIPSKLVSEDLLHKRFRDNRVKGEWFEFESVDLILPMFRKWTADYYYNFVGGVR